MATPTENRAGDGNDAPAVFPAGLHNAYVFAVFNALSFQIILNSPMVLYARTLGASATVLGIIAGLWPLLVIFQIPAAQYVNRVGYRRFVFMGWGTRVAFIFGMAFVPLTGGFLNTTTQLSLLLLLLFGFNLSRGISSAGWLPWIASLIPETIRGRYLARDAACVNLASVGAFLLAALCLGRDPRPWQFAVVFLFSGLMGVISLSFLKRIPDAEPPREPEPRAGGGVPWGAMLLFPPFRKLLVTVIAWSAAYGAMLTFTIAFMKAELQFGEGMILLLNSTMFLGGLSSLWLLGSRLDHLGSKPVLTFAFSVWLVLAAGWGVLAGQVVAAHVVIILVFQFVMGLCGALVSMSNIRLAMAVVPPMGRNHFFALYSVLGSLSLGVTPILWGLLIDAIGERHWSWPHFDWNPYSIFFSAIVVVLAVTLALARRLEEPAAASMEELLRELLVQTPRRVWIRFVPRE